eukprot:PITA_33764
MLRAYVMQQPTKWVDYLHLVEFAYNNGYHTSLQMSPFEVLYGQKCHTPSSWSGPEDRSMLGPNMLKEMEEMARKVRSNLKEAQDRQKNFADQKRRFKEYQVSDHVYDIQVRLFPVVHSKCFLLREIDLGCCMLQVKPEGEILVKPLNILDQREVMLRKQVITQIKVRWQHFGPEEATSEDVELMKKAYPELFITKRHGDNVQS